MDQCNFETVFWGFGPQWDTFVSNILPWIVDDKASNRNNTVVKKVIEVWMYLAQARCKP